MIKPTCPKCGGHDIVFSHRPYYSQPLLGMSLDASKVGKMGPEYGMDEWVCCDDMGLHECGECDFVVHYWGAFFPQLAPGTARLLGCVEPGTQHDDPAGLV